MADILINGTLAPNGPFPLARSTNVLGAPIIAANLTALQNWTNTGTMVVGQIGYATDTGIYYKLTTIGTPHVWTRIDVVKTAVEGSINVVEPVASGYSFWTSANYYGSQLHCTVGFIGGNGSDGQWLVYDNTGTTRVYLDGTGSGSFFADALSIKGGLKDTNVTTAIKLGDAGNTAFNTTNKTIVGAVNELRSGTGAYIESGDLTTSWTAPTASSPKSDIRLTKVGKVVTLYLRSWFATGNGTTGSIVSATGAIPAAYRPTTGEGTVYGVVSTFGGGATEWGGALIDVDGTIVIGINYNIDQFVTTGATFGFSNSSISWILA